MKKCNRMMVMLALWVVLVPGLAKEVKADVIFEPNNSFYKNHMSECVRLERSFVTNGPDGKVTVYDDLSKPKEVGTIDNGLYVYVYYKYNDGTYDWGYVQYNNFEGWLPFPYLKMQYDETVFRQQHANQITYDGWDLDDDFCDQTLAVWSYPASQSLSGEITIPKSDNMMGGADVYVDEYGYSWGYFGYYYGMRGWLCLDNPTASYDELYPDGGPVYRLDENDEAKDVGVIVPKGEGNKTLIIIGLLIAAVVAVTIVLIILLGNKKDSTGDSKLSIQFDMASGDSGFVPARDMGFSSYEYLNAFEDTLEMKSSIGHNGFSKKDEYNSASDAITDTDIFE